MVYSSSDYIYVLAHLGPVGKTWDDLEWVGRMELEIGQGLDYQDCKNTARSGSYNEYIYLQKRN